MNWLAIALALFKLAPDIVKLIAEVETAIGGGNGVTKKAIVMTATEGGPPELVTKISAFIDKVVALKKGVEPVPLVATPKP